MDAWYDNDTLWDDLAPVLFTEDRWGSAPAEVEHLVALIKLPPGSTVLDLGCGPGRHSLEFARRGFAITGVDRTATYLRKAQDKALRDGLEAEWVEADMLHFRRENEFDVAVSLLTSFGYFDDPADDRLVVENLFASLKPGGHIVMDVMSKEVLVRIFQPRDWHEKPDGTILLEERKVTRNWSRIDVRWIIIKGQQRHEHRVGHRIYSAAQLQGLLAGVGFTNVTAYGSLKGTAYDNEAERLVVVAQKPGNL